MWITARNRYTNIRSLFCITVLNNNIVTRQPWAILALQWRAALLVMNTYICIHSILSYPYASNWEDLGRSTSKHQRPVELTQLDFQSTSPVRCIKSVFPHSLTGWLKAELEWKRSSLRTYTVSSFIAREKCFHLPPCMPVTSTYFILTHGVIRN